MNRGELVPDDLVIEIATDRLLADDCKDGFLNTRSSVRAPYIRQKSWMSFSPPAAAGSITSSTSPWTKTSS